MRICIPLLFLAILTCIGTAAALPQPPVANFTVDNSEGTALHTTVHFTDTSTGNPVLWYWSFGDGSNSTLQNPQHIYGYLGAYPVYLTVTNAAGSNTSKAKTIYMADSGTQIATTVPITWTQTADIGTPKPATVPIQHPSADSGTPTPAPLPFSDAILAIIIGAVVVCPRR